MSCCLLCFVFVFVFVFLFFELKTEVSDVSSMSSSTSDHVMIMDNTTCTTHVLLRLSFKPFFFQVLRQKLLPSNFTMGGVSFVWSIKWINTQLLASSTVLAVCVNCNDLKLERGYQCHCGMCLVYFGFRSGCKLAQNLTQHTFRLCLCFVVALYACWAF